MKAKTEQWHVLYTAPRAEKKVKKRLDEKGVTNYLPLHRSPRVWSDRVKLVDKPLFPSYIFVYCHESNLFPLLMTYGVIRIVQYCGRPAVVTRKEIDAIVRFLEEAADRPLCEGDEVEILAGAMKHVSGVIQRIKKKYLYIYIEQLGVMATVDISKVASLNRLR